MIRAIEVPSINQIKHQLMKTHPSNQNQLIYQNQLLPQVKRRGSHWQRCDRQPRPTEHAREKKFELAAHCPEPGVHRPATSHTLQDSDLL